MVQTMVGKILHIVIVIVIVTLLNVGIGNSGDRSSLSISFVFKLHQSVLSKPSAFVVD